MGIGTSSPTNLLTLSNASGGTILEITGSGSNQANISIDNTSGNITIAADNSTGGLTGTAYSGVVGTYANKPLFFVTNSTTRASIDTSGNLNFKTSNAGIVFNNSSASVNSTLNDYETGTWTPNQGSGLTVTGTFRSQGGYVKIGQMVYVNFYISASSITIAANGTVCTNLPFATLTDSIGDYGISINSNNSANYGAEAYVNTVYFSGAGTSTGFSFSITYKSNF